MRTKRRRRETHRGRALGERLCLEQLELRRVLDSTVVFNEVMYHPIGDDPADEWIELHNQMSVDMDLSNWSIDGGVEFQFPDRVTVPGGGYLLVAKDPSRLVAAGVDSPIFGPFSGRLNDGGEQIVLKNKSDRVMDTIDYSDESPWPVGADGSGASLSKRDPQMGSADSASWTNSSLPGGTPGAENFQAFDQRKAVLQQSR